MSYRGEDLDLRTPQSRGAPGSFASDSGRGRHDGPIWVDDTVMACCNHAFEVALAHRASEVRLEHLLHALTRVDAAAQVLESYGIRELALRRESATVIASDIPVGLPNGSGEPRRSEELEIVLRKASQIAGGRDAPASVKDILHVMTDVEPGLRGLDLLHRHLAPSQSYAPEPRYASYDMPPREQVRMVPAYYVNEPPVPRQGDFRPTPTDAIQNNRLDQLDQMVRSIAHDLADERQKFSELLQVLHSDVRAGRDGIEQVSGRLGSSAGMNPDDLERTTRTLEERISNFERSLETRFDLVETALKGAGGEVADLSPLAQRLETIENALLSQDDEASDTLSDKIATRLRGAMSSGAVSSEALGAQVRSVISPITKRLEDLHQTLDTRQGVAASALNALSDRIEKLEDSLSRVSSSSYGSGTKLSEDDLAEVHDALMKLNDNQHTLADAVSKWRGDTEDRVATMSTTIERLHKVTVERYHRRNRLWYWLFGTDDWIAESWPSQAARVEEELKAFQCGYRDSPPVAAAPPPVPRESEVA